MADEARERLREWIETRYASGIPDIDGNRRVSLDIPARMTQRRPWARKAGVLLGRAAVDIGIPILATVTFSLIARVIAGEFLPMQNLLLPTLLFCAAYHYIFVSHKRKTPGAELVSRWE
jgi:hypothetical protein